MTPRRVPHGTPVVLAVALAALVVAGLSGCGIRERRGLSDQPAPPSSESVADAGTTGTSRTTGTASASAEESAAGTPAVDPSDVASVEAALRELDRVLDRAESELAQDR